MNRKLITAITAVAALGSVGYLGGTVYASTTDPGTAEHPPLAATMTYQQPLPAFTKLGNGGTVGSWRLDTPMAERPDYVATQVDGKIGYLRLADISDGLVLPRSTDGTPVDASTQLAEAERRQREVMVQPNADGEIWAPAYASDGVTVIGKKLINPAEDSTAR